MDSSKAPLILLSCLVMHFLPYAQGHDKEGYYINLKGDTISGMFVNYHEFRRNPSTLSFQPSSSPLITLSPSLCQKVSVTHSDTYVSYTGKRMLNATNYKEANADTTNKYEEVTVFLRELFNDGHYKLYILIDGARTNFFFGRETDPLQELYYKEYVKDAVVGTWYKYREQLYSLFSDFLNDHPDQDRLIRNLRFNTDDLIDAFTILTGKEIKKTKAKYPTQIFVGAAASINRLSVTGDASAYYEIGPYTSQTSPLFEAGLKFYSQRNEGRFFVIGRVSFSQFQNGNTFNDGFLYSNTIYHASVLSVPVSAGYTFFTGRGFTLEPSLGIYFAFLSNNYQTQVFSTGGPMKLSNDVQTDIAPFGELALTWKKRLSLVGGYYSPFTVASAASYSAYHSAFTFGMRYYIF